MQAAPATTPGNRPDPEKSAVRLREARLIRCSVASLGTPEITGKKSSLSEDPQEKVWSVTEKVLWAAREEDVHQGASLTHDGEAEA